MSFLICFGWERYMTRDEEEKNQMARHTFAGRRK